MNKISYDVLAVEIEKLYPPIYVLSPNETIDDHLKYIETFIESCGWKVEDYMQEYIHRGVKDLLPPDLQKQN